MRAGGNRWGMGAARASRASIGVTARRGPQKTRRGPKVQRGPNSQTNFGPRSTSDHAEFVHMQRIYSFYFILEFDKFGKFISVCVVYAEYIHMPISNCNKYISHIL
jgi:hypothetical protein